MRCTLSNKYITSYGVIFAVVVLLFYFHRFNSLFNFTLSRETRTSHLLFTTTSNNFNRSILILFNAENLIYLFISFFHNVRLKYSDEIT